MDDRMEMEFRRGLERVLYKTKYETDFSYFFQELLGIKKTLCCKMSYKEMRQSQLEILNDMLCVAKLLLMCKSGGIKEIIGTKDKIRTTTRVSAYIEAKLEDEYKRGFMSYEDMTFEEGKEELEECLRHGVMSLEVSEFIKDWNGVDSDGDDAWYIVEDMTTEDITDEMIEYYIAGRSVRREITNEQISRTIFRLEEEFNQWNRRGAPKKNDNLHRVMKVFSRKGLKNPSNKDCKILYECCDLIGLVDEELKKGWRKSNSSGLEIYYIRSVWKSAFKDSKVFLNYYTY